MKKLSLVPPIPTGLAPLVHSRRLADDGLGVVDRLARFGIARHGEGDPFPDQAQRLLAFGRRMMVHRRPSDRHLPQRFQLESWYQSGRIPPGSRSCAMPPAPAPMPLSRTTMPRQCPATPRGATGFTISAETLCAGTFDFICRFSRPGRVQRTQQQLVEHVEAHCLATVRSSPAAASRRTYCDRVLSPFGSVRRT